MSDIALWLSRRRHLLARWLSEDSCIPLALAGQCLLFCSCAYRAPPAFMDSTVRPSTANVPFDRQQDRPRRRHSHQTSAQPQRHHPPLPGERRRTCGRAVETELRRKMFIPHTRSCVCGGSNENCRWCFGSGYIREGQGAPRGRQATSSRLGRKGRSARPRNSCPVCGLLVARLQRHLNKVHNGSTAPAAQQTSESKRHLPRCSQSLRHSEERFSPQLTPWQKSDSA